MGADLFVWPALTARIRFTAFSIVIILSQQKGKISATSWRGCGILGSAG